MVKPQDKEMKMQWITVDGRRTPIILPQIWDHEKEDWVVTSTENPLPTQVTGSNVEKKVLVKRGIYNKNTANVGFRPPEGSKSMKLELTVDGATGSFESEQGASIYLLSRTDSGGSYGFVQSEKVSSARGTVIDWGKGIDYQG